VSVPFYVPPEQLTKEKADFARRGIARGRPLIVLEYAGGILFVAENPSTHLRKVAELYDRIAFAAVGRYSEFENLRQAGVRLADIRGYAYGREDVTSRSIANAYSQTLGQIFVQEFKPYEVELCVAEVGTDGAPNAIYQESVRAFVRTWYRELVPHSVDIADGHILPPFAPGIGTYLLPEVPGRADATVQTSTAG
jgi:proteasome alpha subunit